jgi:hypothetical protein
MERERTLVTALLILQIVLWLGFVIHRAPRFAGSLSGGILGVSGAILMVIFPLAYSTVKRLPALKKSVTPHISLRTLLTWHVYTGIVGSILALWHTGHRFESPLGMGLTAMMMLAVLSGYVGRHFLGQVSLDLREKQELLNKLSTSYNELAGQLARQPDSAIGGGASEGVVRWMGRRVFGSAGGDPQSARQAERVMELAESIAELDFSITTHGRLKRSFAVWLKVHVVTSLAFYYLLTLHIWASIYFGLRWFS